MAPTTAEPRSAPVEVMTRAGFSDENAAAVYRAFSSFLLGYLLLEVSAHGVETGPVEEPDVEDVQAVETKVVDDGQKKD